MTSHSTVYLDHASSTPVDAGVLEAMLPWFQNQPWNASSRHALGRQAAAAVETARTQVADLIGCDPDGITFTGSATESCNLAIKGLLRPRLRRGEPVHIVSSAIEHPAVLDSIRRLEREGAEAELVAPTSGGRIAPDEVERRIRDDTSLVSIMWVNNELGTINDVERIGELCRDKGVLFHCDASQAVGKIGVDLGHAPIDAISLCAHKMHGPKGAGALVLQGRAAGRPIEPLIEGGGHERHLRSGTLNVPALVGFGAAAKLVQSDLELETRRMQSLRDALQTAILEAHPNATVNGDQAHRAPHILNVSIPTASTESLASQLPHVACSSGAACSSARDEPSHVLTAIGLSAEVIAGTIRLSVGRSTTERDVRAAAHAVHQIACG